VCNLLARSTKSKAMGYEHLMTRFRIGLALGMAAGYYLGAKAGRQRYDQINRAVARLRKSDAFEVAAEKAKAVVDLGVERAKDAVGSNTYN
jgi:membrane protein DedA with SNARE-associated domain